MYHKPFHKTFSHLHASESTLQEVMNMANNPKNRRRTIGRTVMLAAALAVLSSLVLTVSAAGLLTDIIAKFAPAKKPSDTLSEIYGTAVSTEAPHDPGLLTIDDCTFSVEGSFPVGPNTVTLKDFAMNGMGIGVLTFTVENPDGVGFTLSEDGALTLSGDLQAPRFFVDKDAPLGDNAAVTQLRLIREEDTLLDLVMYFGFQDIPFYGTPMYLEFTSTGTGEQTTVEVSLLPPKATTACWGPTAGPSSFVARDCTLFGKNPLR